MMTRKIEEDEFYSFSDTSGSVAIEDQKIEKKWTSMRQNIQIYLSKDKKEKSYESMVQ
jgi:hypothetical protein